MNLAPITDDHSSTLRAMATLSPKSALESVGFEVVNEKAGSFTVIVPIDWWDMLNTSPERLREHLWRSTLSKLASVGFEFSDPPEFHEVRSLRGFILDKIATNVRLRR